MSYEATEDKILSRRFDLMKKMYFSEKDKVIDWFLCKFADYQRNKQSLEYKLLWETFHDILVEEKSLSGSRILIKSNSVKSLLDAVQEYPYSNSWAHVILSSISTFLQTSSVNASLISDIDTLMKLLIQTLKVISNVYIFHRDDQQSLDEGVNLTSIVLDILENLPSADEDCWVPNLAHFLKDISLFIYISTSEKRFENISERLTKKIISTIFNLKSKKYETLLSSEIVADELVPPNYNILCFFHALQNALNSEEMVSSIPVSLTCASLIQNMVHSFLTYNKSSLHSYKVIALFFATCGLDIPFILGITSSCKSLFKKQYATSDISMLGISHILEACSSFPHYFCSMGVPDGYVKLSMWLSGVFKLLLDTENIRSKSDWLKCFQFLITISSTVAENDIVPFIKMVLLNISVKGAESKMQYCQLFKVVLQVYSQLHQLPIFFVKFLLALIKCIPEDSGGKFLINGQLLPEVEESFAKCIQNLHHSQVLDIWKTFIETFSTVETMTKNFLTNKGYIFLVSQLFSTFLFHAQLFHPNIPSSIQQQFSTLIGQTSSKIEHTISSFKETHSRVIPLRRSVLLLSYAIGEVKLAYIADHGQPIEECDISLLEHVFEFSILHKFLDKDTAILLETFMNGEDKILTVLTFQLLLQKLKICQFKVLSEAEKKHVQEIVSTVLHYLKASECAVASWDRDLCCVTDKNYGTVMWKMFLKVFPLLMSKWSHKDFCLLCSSAHDILSKSDNFDGAKSAILSFLKTGFFQESKHFQTAFVTVIWNLENLIKPSRKRMHKGREISHPTSEKIFSLLNAYHSKDPKYAERTPKSNKSLGSMWEEIKEISDLMNSILLSESLPKDQLLFERISDFIKIFKCLPLEYVLPGNQMKCIIGLSYLFFLIPQSCSPSDGLYLAKEISSVLVSIFEGVRSIWLFDFITSGPYMKSILTTINFVISDESDDLDWAIHLIDHFISLIIRNPDAVKSFEPCISRFIEVTQRNKTTLITFHALLKKLSQVISHSHKQEAYRNILLKTTAMTCLNFAEYMKITFNQSVESTDHHFFIKCFTYIIEIVCHPGFENEANVCKRGLELLSVVLTLGFEKLKSANVDDLSDVYLLFISKICKHSSKISSYLPDNFESASWSVIVSHFEKKAALNKKNELYVKMHTFSDPLAIDSTTCDICFSKNAQSPFLTNMEHKIANMIHTDGSTLFSESEKECLKEFSSIASCEQLLDVFNSILEKMGCSSSSVINIFSFHLFLTLFQCLINTNTEKCQNPLLNQPIQKCMSFLLLQMNNTCPSQSCQLMVSVPILDFMSFVIKENRGLSYQVLYQSLHCVAFVLNDDYGNEYELYSRIFIAAWNVVYNLFTHHTAVVLASPSPFLAYVSKLLKSITKAGSAEDLSKCDTRVFQQVHLCAENMNRLLTMISRHKKEFSKLAHYLFADYIDTVQHITLEPSIKESILSGVHRLLDLCSDDSIKMLAVNINYVCREVLSNIVNNYRQQKYTNVT